MIVPLLLPMFCTNTDPVTLTNETFTFVTVVVSVLSLKFLHVGDTTGKVKRFSGTDADALEIGTAAYGAYPATQSFFAYVQLAKPARRRMKAKKERMVACFVL